MSFGPYSAGGSANGTALQLETGRALLSIPYYGKDVQTDCSNNGKAKQPNR
jgi:hypothetical protein